MLKFHAIILGAGGVGKSALTLRFIRNQFVDIYDPTIEEVFTKDIDLDEHQQVRLEVLDTAGAEQFTAINEFYLKRADGFLLVYSLTSKQTLNELEPILRQILEVKGVDISEIPILIVGTKSDLVDEREVSSRTTQQFAQKWNLRSRETSAKRNVGVVELFHELSRQMMKQHTRLETKRKVKNRKSKRSLHDPTASFTHRRSTSRQVDSPRGQAIVYKNPRTKSCTIM